jgi:branched-chain amino acid transport system ATP-binding protein
MKVLFKPILGLRMLLRLKDISVYYGKALALDCVSLEIQKGNIVSIIGANGAGKSTILKALSGLTPISAGEIWFMNARIDSMAPFDIVALGLVQVPEGRRLFPYLSVLDNLELGASLRKDKSSIAKDLGIVIEYFPALKGKMKRRAGSLSGGEQQMLAIGRALLAKANLLLLDEPSLGLAPMIIKELGHIIRRINGMGVSVLLAEQNVPLAFRVADVCYVLQTGRVILEGNTEEIKNNPIVKKAYLGESVVLGEG